MSLINQLLHDLDRRQRGATAEGVLRDLLPAEVLAADSRLLRALPWGLLAAALLALAWLWTDQRTPTAARRDASSLAMREIHAPAPAPAARDPVAAPSRDATRPGIARLAPASASPLEVATPATPLDATDALPVTPATPTRPAPGADEARAALLEAERDWRPSPDIDPDQSIAPVQASDLSEVEQSSGAMHIAPSAATRADHAAQRVREADQLIARGEVASGLARLHEATRVTPGEEAPRLAYVRQLLRAGRAALAEHELRAGLAADPRAARLAQTLAHLQFDGGDARGALATLLPAAPPVAAAPQYHVFIAALQQRTDDHRAASATWRAVLEHTPGDGAAWIGLAISLTALDERGAARAAFVQARASGALSPAMDAYAAAELARLGAQP